MLPTNVGESSIYLKCLSVLGARDAVMKHGVFIELDGDDGVAV